METNAHKTQRVIMKKREHQALLNSSLAALGYLSPLNDEELPAPEELHKDYVPNRHVDVNRIINGEWYGNIKQLNMVSYWSDPSDIHSYNKTVLKK